MHTRTDDRRHQELLPEIPPSQPDLGLHFSWCLTHLHSGTKGLISPKHTIIPLDYSCKSQTNVSKEILML